MNRGSLNFCVLIEQYFSDNQLVSAFITSVRTGGIVEDVD